LQASA